MSSYLHGSAALGGFHPSVSDLDLLVVVDDRPPLIGEELQAIGEAITGVPRIGRRVELSVVATSAARDPAPPWPFLLHVVTTPGHEQVRPTACSTRHARAQLLAAARRPDGR